MNIQTANDHWLGMRPDTADQRDHRFALSYPAPATEPVLPRAVDLRRLFPNDIMPPYDQGRIGSCVGNAIAFCFDYARRRQGVQGYLPSRLFIYYGAREIENTIASDAGCEIRDGIKVVANLGAPPEELWTYDITKFAMKPRIAAYTSGTSRRAIAYARVNNVGSSQEIRAALASGVPVVLGISVYESFESDTTAMSGHVAMPQPSEAMLGGHCMVAVGYRPSADGPPEFIVRNSWGSRWGDHGYCYIPEPYLIDDNLTSDLWVLRGVE